MAFKSYPTQQQSQSTGLVTNPFVGYQKFGQSNINSTEQLLHLAMQQGGAVAEAALELTHPERSMLSTIGGGLKNSFMGFIKVLSTPANIVAGMISPDKTIKEAMEENLWVSEVLLGKVDENATTMEKVGQFFVRLPIDIMTDPITYLTFGAAKGVLGLTARQKLTLGEKAVVKLGISKEFANVATRGLNLKGDQLINYLHYAQKQAKGLARMSEKEAAAFMKKSAPKLAELKKEAIKTVGRKQVRAGRKELDNLLKATINSPLDIDYAKRAMTNLLERHPALVHQYLDKGGIKYFGKTILSSQRIDSVIEFVPGLSLIDHATKNTRHAIQALFDPTMKKVGREYIKLPEEFAMFMQSAKDLKDSTGTDILKNLSNVARTNKITVNEARDIMDALGVRKIPRDPRLANVYKTLKGFSEEQWRMMNETGKPVAFLDLYNAHMLVRDDAVAIPFKGSGSGLAKDFKSGKQAQFAKFIQQDTNTLVKDIPDDLARLKTEMPDLAESMTEAKSVQEAGFKIDEFIEKRTDELVESGLTFEKAHRSDEITKLMDLREQVDTFAAKESQRLGTAEMAGLKPKLRVDEVKEIIANVTQKVAKGEITQEKIGRDILTLAARANDIFKKKGIDATVKAMKEAGVDVQAENLKQFLKVLEFELGTLDIDKLVTQKLAAEFKGGVILPKELADMSAEALDNLRNKLARAEDALPEDIEKLSRMIDTIEPKLATSKHVGGAEGEIRDLAMKERAAAAAKTQAEMVGLDRVVGQTTTIAQTKWLPEDRMAHLVANIRNQFEQDPVGVKAILNEIIGKEQKLVDIAADIDLEKTIAAQSISDLPSVDRYFRDNQDLVYKRVASTVKEASEAGWANFENNVFLAYASVGLQNNSQIVGQHFMRGLTEGWLKPASQAPSPKWIPIPSAGINEKAQEMLKVLVAKNGEEMVAHPAIAQAVADFLNKATGDAATGDMLKAFDKIQRYWKASVTSIFPAFHGRNAISNVLLNFLDLGVHAFNPTYNSLAGSLILKDRQANRYARLASGVGEKAEWAKGELDKLNGTKVFTDAFGDDYSFGEMRQLLKTHNVAFNPNIVGAIDVPFDTDASIDFFFRGFKPKTRRVVGGLVDSDVFIPFRAGRHVCRTVEEHARLVNFIANLKATGDVTHAAQRTKMFLFDYANLTAFEKNVMRRLIPFYTFTRKNLELQAKTLLTTPGRIAAEVTALKTLGDVMAGGSLTPEEKDALPEWIKSGINILRKKRGSTVEILGSLGTPIEQPFQAFQPNQLLGSISPIIRVPLEQMSGYSFFNGKMLSDVTNAAAFKSAPKVVQDFIGFTAVQGQKSDGSNFEWFVALRPERMNLLLNLPPTSRVLSSLKQMQAVDVAAQTKILQQTIGLRPYSFDLEQEAAKREREMQKTLEKILTDAGVTAKFERVFIPKN